MKQNLSLLPLIIVVICSCDAKFTAYWNVPISRCSSLGVDIELDEYNIVHNSNGEFLGDKVKNHLF